MPTNLKDFSILAQNEGLQSEIRIFPKGRRCPKGNCLLSIYTEGPYCRVHENYGFKIERKLYEEKKAKQVEKASKKSQAKDREKIRQERNK